MKYENLDPPTEIPGGNKKSVSSEAKEMFDQFLQGDDVVLDKQVEVEVELTKPEVIEKFHKILRVAQDIGASDVFLKTGIPPSIRHDGNIQFLKFDNITDNEAKVILEEMCDKFLLDEFRNEHEVDTAYQVDGIGRFRVNAFLQRGFIGFVMRLVKFEIPTFDQLNLPDEALIKLAGERRGLILVTGITGSGKTTTLASFLEYINSHFNRHIITIEDPIEFIYFDKKSIINQREVGMDTRSFATALKHVVRQSPDVILVGEMRDKETMEAAINAAETGHLVFSTLHSTNAPQTLDRILNFFPPHQHVLIRSQLASILKGIISQRLIKRMDSLGRAPAVEILTNSPTVKQAIDEGRFMDLTKVLEESSYFGMQTFNQSLVQLINKKMISRDDALAFSDDPDKLLLEFRGISKSSGAQIQQQLSSKQKMDERRKRRAKDLLR